MTRRKKDGPDWLTDIQRRDRLTRSEKEIPQIRTSRGAPKSSRIIVSSLT